MKRVKQFCLEAVMFLLSLVVLFPVLYAVVSSFKTRSEIGEPLSLPHSLYLGNYENVFINLNVLGMLKNSFIVVAASMILIVLIGSLAAYPLGRKSKGIYMVLYLFFLSGLMIPFSAGIVPLFQLIKGLRLMNGKSDAHNNYGIFRLCQINFAGAGRGGNHGWLRKNQCLYAHYFTASETGGDYYCYYKYPSRME